MRAPNQKFLNCFIALFSILFAQSQVGYGQTSLCSEIEPLEISVLDFLYNHRSLCYEVITPISLEAIDSCCVKIGFANSKKKHLLSDEESHSPVRIDYHEWSYIISPDEYLILKLKNANGGTPWSTLSARVLTLYIE